MMESLMGAALLAISFAGGVGIAVAQSAAAASAKASPVPAQAPVAAANADAVSHGKTVLLWPGGAPKAVGGKPEDTPTLTIFLPTKNTTKTGVVIAPGGGYAHLAMQHEGEDIARWLNVHGVAAFVLKYRLGPVYHHPLSLATRNGRSGWCG